MSCYTKNVVRGTLFSLLLGAVVAIANTPEEMGEEQDSENMEQAAPPEASGLDQREVEETLAAKAAGSYERKSIAFLDALWNLDRSIFRMPSEAGDRIKQGTRELFNNPRFDQNALPSELQSRFVWRANQELERRAGKGKSIEVLTNLVNEILLPPILAAVEADAVSRAEGLLSDEQRNAMIVDKAKELGVTALELNQVRNSAFLVIPMVEGWVMTIDKESVSVSISLGAAIWRIVVRDGVARAIPIEGIESTAVGFGGKGVVGIYRAWTVAINTALRNIERQLKDIPEFRLSSQAASVDGATVESKIGRKEGLKVDDKMRFAIESIDNDGVTTQNLQGWARVVYVPTEAEEKEGKMSLFAVVAGSPVEGDVMVEYARLPLDLVVGWGYRPMRIKVVNDMMGDSSYYETAQQFLFGADYVVGRSLGISQLYLGVEAAFALVQPTEWGESNGLETASRYEFSLLLSKRLSWKRVGLTLQGGVGYSLIGWGDDEDATRPAQATPAALLATVGGAVDLALHPSLQLRAGARGIFASAVEDKGFQQEFDGLAINIGFVWSPPGLPFDPANLLLN